MAQQAVWSYPLLRWLSPTASQGSATPTPKSVLGANIYLLNADSLKMSWRWPHG